MVPVMRFFYFSRMRRLVYVNVVLWCLTSMILIAATTTNDCCEQSGLHLDCENRQVGVLEGASLPA